MTAGVTVFADGGGGVFGWGGVFAGDFILRFFLLFFLPFRFTRLLRITFFFLLDNDVFLSSIARNIMATAPAAPRCSISRIRQLLPESSTIALQWPRRSSVSITLCGL